MFHCYICVTVALLALAVLANPASAKDSHKLFHLSDIHLDPFFGTPCAIGPCRNTSVRATGLPGCDSSPAMLNGAVRAVARAIVVADVDFATVVYTGDWLRHDMTASCVKNPQAVAFDVIDTIVDAFSTNLTAMIREFEEQGLGQNARVGRKRARSVHVVPSLQLPVVTGNEDYIPDYHFNASSGLPHPILRHFGSRLLAKRLLPSAAQADEFALCGFTYHDQPLLNLRFLTLNTLLWSSSITPPIAANNTDPCGQFGFVEAQLAMARSGKMRVVVVSHIPPLFLLWQSQFFDRYVALMQSYADVVVLQMYGHIHRFSYGALAKGQQNMSPVLIGGPITRVSKTIPDFGVLTLDPTSLQLQDYHQWSLVEGATDPSDDAAWSLGPSFTQTMGIANMSAATLYQLSDAMRYGSNAKTLFDKFFAFDLGGRLPSDEKKCDTFCRHERVCMTMAFDVVDAGICML